MFSVTHLSNHFSHQSNNQNRPAGALGASVTTFCICALICFFTLIYRRKTYGYELGGPSAPAKQSAGLFVCLWLTYIIVSIVMEP